MTLIYKSEDVKAQLACPYSAIHASEGSINGEFNGEIRPKQTLLPFPSTQWLAE